KQAGGESFEFIEEPFKNPFDPEAKKVASVSAIPLIADESFQNENDLPGLKEIFHGINIKLDKCGGLTPALGILQKAKDLGLKTLIGCMSCSGIGLRPSIALAGACDFVDLDAVLLIRGDTHGVYYKEGVVNFDPNSAH
ncbi:MAG: dipeptide epimerase, partial [Saprospiraceae bacterium]|nr:dipeptide epimerase [Saprospiraceae bacterium]